MRRLIVKYHETIVEFIVLISIFLFLLSYFKPELILSPTHISAGDTVGHYYPMYYLNKVLLPEGEIIGWCPNWFLGYPMFQFYFPLTFLIGALLGYIIPLPVAFKIITILGTFLLPICTFFSFRLMKFKFPLPLIGAIFTLPFLFLENYSMWGGNIPSTLAGEFSYSFSLSLSILLIGGLYRGIKEKKYIVPNSILFALVTLSHVFPAMFVVGASLFFLLNRKKFKSNILYLSKVFLLGLMLCGFWFFPMVTKSEYTVPHLWFPPESLSKMIEWLFPEEKGKFIPLKLFLGLAILGSIIGYKKKDERVYYFIFSMVVATTGFLISPILNTFNIQLFRHFQFVKFIPIFYLFLFLLSSYVFTVLLNIRGKWLLPIILLIVTVFFINKGITYIPYWINWNYSGYEAKKLWNAYKDANEFLSKLPKGRVVFEYDPHKYDSGLGSSRATETIPVFSGKPITEGTHFQSAFNGPYIYYAHCEYSNGCSCLFGPETHGCPSFNLTSATIHLELFNVKYLFVSSDKLKNALRNNPNYRMLHNSGAFEIWELKTHNGSYVTLPRYEPVLIRSKNWREISYLWFKNPEYDDIPLVFSRGEKIDESKFKYIFETIDDLSKLPRDKIESDCYIKETIKRKEIYINTSCIGKPLLIKISYFPNWKVEGADKIYLVSPGFMLIFPEKENVKLYYGWTFSDIFGLLATIIGILIVLYNTLIKINSVKPFKKVVHK